MGDLTGPGQTIGRDGQHANRIQTQEDHVHQVFLRQQ